VPPWPLQKLSKSQVSPVGFQSNRPLIYCSLLILRSFSNPFGKYARWWKRGLQTVCLVGVLKESPHFNTVVRTLKRCHPLIQLWTLWPPRLGRPLSRIKMFQFLCLTLSVPNKRSDYGPSRSLRCGNQQLLLASLDSASTPMTCFESFLFIHPADRP